MSCAVSWGGTLEVTFLETNVVAEIAAFVIGIGVGRKLDRVELESSIVGLDCIFHVIEDEELGFRPEEHRVAEAHGLDQTLGLLGDGARVAVVRLASQRFEGVANQDKRRLRIERIDAGALGVRHELHVRFVDRLPAGNGGAIEHDAFAEGILLDGRDVGGDVLPFAARIGEAEIGVFYVIILDQLHDFFGRSHRTITLFS